MSLLRSFSVARTSLQLQLRDPASSIVMTILPLIMIAILIPGAKAQLVLSGYPHATGAEQVVPGFAVLFAFLSVTQVSTLFFREYAWGTWDRLRASSASTADIVTGKVVVRFLVQLLQTAIVLAVCALLFGYHPNGSVLAIGIVVIVFTVMLVAFGVMLVALFRTMDQAMVIGNLGGMLMTGLGGALAPVASFPNWAQTVAHFSPAYWVLNALGRLTLEHATLADVLPALGVTLSFAAAFTLVAALRFRSNTVKVGTT
jgi:ABC-2 type transport system permease protein